ncbi:hypothetical protein ABZX92_12075 [Lentzea sp. NPDC006480]|uniref:hypothetical protein n=1 Tax=Lentzea sp. NPDC006480 TaxID=3157176 RepID=UPI0033B2FE35
MSFAVLLGAILGSTAVKAGALVTAILVIIVSGIALLTRRRAERRELEVHKDLVSQYCKLLDAGQPSYEVIDWDKTAVIGERGDTHIKLKVKLRATHDDFWFVRLRLVCGWPQPSRYRRQVRMTVRNLQVDGSPGTTLRTTVSWLRDGAMAAIIHFHTAPALNSVVSFTVDVDWPKMCAPLLEGSPDEFDLMFWQTVRRSTYRVVLPKGIGVYVEPIGKTEDFKGFRWRKKAGDDGREVIVFRLSDPPVRHRAGVRLQMKQAHRAAPLR